MAIAGYALIAVTIGLLVVLARSAVHSEQGRSRTSDSVSSVRAFVPRTETEKRWFDAMSVTASVFLAGLVFGLAHLYQGAAGVAKTGTLGVLFGVVYWMTGSVWAPIVLHAVVDLASGWITRQIVADDDLHQLAGPITA